MERVKCFEYLRKPCKLMKDQCVRVIKRVVAIQSTAKSIFQYF